MFSWGTFVGIYVFVSVILITVSCYKFTVNDTKQDKLHFTPVLFAQCTDGTASLGITSVLSGFSETPLLNWHRTSHASQTIAKSAPHHVFIFYVYNV